MHKLHRKYFIIIVVLALACIALVSINLWKDAHTPVPKPNHEISTRPLSPYPSYISGVGIVEPSSENIFVGTPVNRIVDKIAVSVGQKVKKGDVLFRLESRDLQADLASRIVAYQDAVARLQKLEALPRKEDVAAVEAQLKNGQIELEQAKSQYDRVQGLEQTRALSDEEISRRHFRLEQAEAKVQQIQADLDKTKAGAWKPDLEIARLQVLQAKTNVKRTKADIARTIIRSPIDGTVLQIKTHEGESPLSEGSKSPPIIIGNTNPLHVRVSINQFDASHFRQDAPAVAFVQGNARVEFPLKFVKLEPYFVAKQNLTNEITEKVDTRVLQAIYCFDKDDQRIFVGQQMDVFIKTDGQEAE